MQRRNRFSGLLCFALLYALTLAVPLHAQSSATTIEESFGTWYQWPVTQGGNDHWYGLIRLFLDSAAADGFANAWGGHLASFADQNERDFLGRIVTNRFNNSPYRIALLARPGQTWQWTDGTEYSPKFLPSIYASYTNTSVSTNQMAITPSGTMQFFADYTLSAALFEIAADPSKLSPYITQVKTLDREIRSPGIARLQASAFGPGILTYQWKVGGIPVLGATSNVLELPISTLSTGKVSVAVSNANGTVESNPIDLAIVPVMFTAPGMIWKQWPISQGGNDHWYGLRQHFGHYSNYFQVTAFAERLEAELVTLQTEAEAKQLIQLYEPNFSEIWLGSATNSAGELVWNDGSAPAYTNWASIQPNAANPAAAYVILNRTIEDYSGKWIYMTPDHSVEVTILERTNSPVDIAPWILNDIAPLRLSAGATNMIEFDVIAGPPAYYQWFFGDTRLDGETNLTLKLHPRNVSESGSYYLVVSNSFGVAKSNPVQLTVSTPAPITIQAQPFGSSLLLDFENAEDVESLTLEYSADLVTWTTIRQFSPRDCEIAPGEFRTSVDLNGDITWPVFYRLQRFP